MRIHLLTGMSLVLMLSASMAVAADGAAIYKGQCAKCHGDTGHADTTVGKAMKVPALVGDAEVQKMSDAEIAKVIATNAKHPPSVKGLNADDVNAAAAYVKTLSAGK